MKKIFVLPLLLFVCVIGNAQKSSIPTPEMLTNLFFFDINSGFIVADNILYYTDDGGDNWKKITDAPSEYDNPAMKTTSKGIFKLPYGNTIKDIFFLDKDTGWIAVSGMGGCVYRTVNGGKTWKPQAGYDNPKIAHHYYKTLYFIDNKIGFAGATNFTFEATPIFDATADGGNKYVPISLENKDINTMMSSGILKIYFSDAKTGWAVGSAGIIKSVDGGYTWYLDTTKIYEVDYAKAKKDQSIEPVKRIPTFESIYFLDADNGIAAAGYEIFITFSGGKSWYGWVDTNNVVGELTSAIMIDDQTAIAAGGMYPIRIKNVPSSGFLIKTTDGGQNWSILEQSDYPFGPIQKLKEGQILIGGKNKILIYGEK